MIDWLPSVPNLQKNPELAALAILDATLDATRYALYAEYPDIHDYRLPLGPNKPLLSLIVAREILSHTERLQESIHWYKTRLEEEE